MELNKYREQIDTIDDELVRLFVARMSLSEKVAEYKKEHNLPIYVPAREREILQDVAKKAGSDMANYTKVLYSMLFELSRSYQSKCNCAVTSLYKQITESIENTPKLFPQAPMVACQGVEGAFSQIACEKIFKDPFPVYFKNMDAVFQAVENGLCEYGVLPIENSAGGSVKKTQIGHVVITLAQTPEQKVQGKLNTFVTNLNSKDSATQVVVMIYGLNKYLSKQRWYDKEI